MEYRKLPHGNEKISVLRMGTSVVGEASEKNVVETSPMHLTTESIILTLQVDMPRFSPASAKQSREEEKK